MKATKSITRTFRHELPHASGTWSFLAKQTKAERWHNDIRGLALSLAHGRPLSSPVHSWALSREWRPWTVCLTGPQAGGHEANQTKRGRLKRRIMFSALLGQLSSCAAVCQEWLQWSFPQYKLFRNLPHILGWLEQGCPNIEKVYHFDVLPVANVSQPHSPFAALQEVFQLTTRRRRQKGKEANRMDLQGCKGSTNSSSWFE